MVEKRVEQDLRTSDMTDDVVNVEFLQFIQVWGPRIFIAICLCVISFQLFTWWDRTKQDNLSEAWRDLGIAQLDGNVSSLMEVADDFSDIGSISELAWLSAAEIHYATILLDEPLDIEGDALSDALGDALDDSAANADEEGDETNAEEENATDEAETTEPVATHLSEEDRSETLERMRSLYEKVLARTTDDPGKLIFKIRAVFGLAMVDEMSGNFDAAQVRYTEAEALASPRFSKLKQLAVLRKANVATANHAEPLMTSDELQAIVDARTVPELLQRPEDEVVGPPEGDSQDSPATTPESGTPGEGSETNEEGSDGENTEGGGQ